MQAIILAGGKGTRLKSVVEDLPKPMAIVNNKPFLTYILEQLYKQKFDKIIIAVGYKKEQIINYYGDNYKNIPILYSIENYPLGTGGCIKKALNLVDDDYVYIINGDTFFDINLQEMDTKDDICIACKYLENFDRYGCVKIVNNKIIDFIEKQHFDSGFINAGIYKINKNIFNNYNLEEKFSLEKDFFEKYKNTLSINAKCFDKYFIDIGIPSDYYKAQEDFKDEKGIISR